MKINFSLEGSCIGARLRPLNLFEGILRSQVYNFIHDLSMDNAARGESTAVHLLGSITSHYFSYIREMIARFPGFLP